MWIASASLWSVSRQRSARWRMVNEQAERAAGVFGDEVQLGANATRHSPNPLG
jgi:hypothetical protein